MPYGGDYNPEQWPDDVWDVDHAAFSLARIDTLTVGVRPVEDALEHREVVGVLVGLGQSPGEHADRQGVDTGQREGGMVDIPHVVGPLLGVVVAAVRHPGGRRHGHRRSFSY